MRSRYANNAPVSYCNVQSSCGHDAFLLPNDLAVYGEMMRAFLDQLVPGPTPAPLSERKRKAPPASFTSTGWTTSASPN